MKGSIHYSFIILYSPMKINQRERVGHTPEFQLSKLLESLPYRTSHRKDSEFDDRNISQTPQTRLSERGKAAVLRQDSVQEIQRKERIKSKIKCQVREKIRKLASREMSYKRSAELENSSRSHFLSVQAKSDYFHVRSPEKLQKINEIIGNCVIEPLHLHEKILPRRNAKIRSRLVSNILEMRSQMRTSLNQRPINLVRMKMSTPNLQAPNPQGINERLQPWRYNDQGQMEENIFKRMSPTH